MKKPVLWGSSLMGIIKQLGKGIPETTTDVMGGMEKLSDYEKDLKN